MDIALIWDNATMRADIAIAGVDLAADEGLVTAVLLSLFLKRRAEPGDVLPDDTSGPFRQVNRGSGDRGGWWGDWYAPAAIETLRARGLLATALLAGQLPTPAPSDLIGSRWWLLQRAKATAENVAACRDYAAEALQWLVDDGVAASVNIGAVGRGDALVPTVTIVKPSGALVNFAFGAVWAAQAGAMPRALPPAPLPSTLDEFVLDQSELA